MAKVSYLLSWGSSHLMTLLDKFVTSRAGMVEKHLTKLCIQTNVIPQHFNSLLIDHDSITDTNTEEKIQSIVCGLSRKNVVD